MDTEEIIRSPPTVLQLGEQMMGHSGIILVILSIILIMVIMRIMCFIVDDSHRKLPKAFILNHDDTLVFCCRGAPLLTRSRGGPATGRCG